MWAIPPSVELTCGAGTPAFVYVQTMAYDEDLADRTRELVAVLAVDFTEQKMFGGLAFMVSNHMACAIGGNDLLVRVGAHGRSDALARGANDMVMGERTMHGFVVVAGDQLCDGDVLAGWVQAGCQLAQSLPPKQPRRRVSPPRIER